MARLFLKGVQEPISLSGDAAVDIIKQLQLGGDNLITAGSVVFRPSQVKAIEKDVESESEGRLDLQDPFVIKQALDFGQEFNLWQASTNPPHRNFEHYCIVKGALVLAKGKNCKVHVEGHCRFNQTDLHVRNPGLFTRMSKMWSAHGAIQSQVERESDPEGTADRIKTLVEQGKELLKARFYVVPSKVHP